MVFMVSKSGQKLSQIQKQWNVGPNMPFDVWEIQLVGGGCQTFDLVDHVCNVRASLTPKWKRLRKQMKQVWGLKQTTEGTEITRAVHVAAWANACYSHYRIYSVQYIKYKPRMLKAVKLSTKEATNRSLIHD